MEQNHGGEGAALGGILLEQHSQQRGGWSSPQQCAHQHSHRGVGVFARGDCERNNNNNDDDDDGDDDDDNNGTVINSSNGTYLLGPLPLPPPKLSDSHTSTVSGPWHAMPDIHGGTTCSSPETRGRQKCQTKRTNIELWTEVDCSWCVATPPCPVLLRRDEKMLPRLDYSTNPSPSLDLDRTN